MYYISQHHLNRTEAQQSLRRTGQEVSVAIETEEQFWAQARETEPSGCREWSGACLYNGYGRLSFQGQSWLAHRLAYTLANGAIPQGDGYHGTVVMHSCDNRRCCNPLHLKLGSHQDNMSDMAAKGRSTKGRSMEGRRAHRNFRRANGPKKLTEQQVLEIRADPRTPSQIAASGDYPVGQNSIWRIKTGRGWYWVEAANGAA